MTLTPIGSVAIQVDTPDGLVDNRTFLYACDICGAAVAILEAHTHP